MSTALSLLLSAGHVFAGSPQQDACGPLIPDSLRSAVGRQYSAYRLPREVDSLPEDVAYAREHGNSPCLGIASADLDGDGAKDLALIMSSIPPKEIIVVVALARNKSWHFETIERFDGAPLRWFVDRAEPGRYVETEAGDGSDADPRSRKRLDSKNDGLFIGRTEAAARAYFRHDGKWVYVQVSG